METVRKWGKEYFSTKIFQEEWGNFCVKPSVSNESIRSALKKKMKLSGDMSEERFTH